jgi:phosphatidylinositol alpha 1,6-mannosyltransferase
MRIAYFNATLNAGQDGVTRCVYRMIGGALERGHEVIGVTAMRPTDPPPVTIHTVPSVILPLQKSYRIAIPGLTDLDARLRSFQPDILHLNSPCTLGFAALRWARLRGIPVVATYHTHFPAYPRYYNMRSFEELTWYITRSFYRKPDVTFVPTIPILRELESRSFTHLEYLPNGVDLDRFKSAYRCDEWRKTMAGNKPVVLFVSRLVWEKDLRVLIEMYQRLRAVRDDFSMIVVGDGHARRDLEQLMPGARFLGYQRGRELSTAFASADVFVFPSTTETFGLVTLEAMASGTVPVAADAGGTSELVCDGHTGFLVPPFDAIALADRVALLLDNPEIRLALARRAQIAARVFSWDRIIDRLFERYQTIIDQFRDRYREAA